jgi:hypothetical protein
LFDSKRSKNRKEFIMKKLLALGLLLAGLASANAGAVEEKANTGTACDPYLEQWLDSVETLSQKAAILADNYNHAKESIKIYGKPFPGWPVEDPKIRAMYAEVEKNHQAIAAYYRKSAKCYEEIAQKLGIPLATIDFANRY